VEGHPPRPTDRAVFARTSPSCRVLFTAISRHRLQQRAIGLRSTRSCVAPQSTRSPHARVRHTARCRVHRLRSRAHRLRDGEAHCVELDGPYVFDVGSERGERSWLWYSAAEWGHGISGRGTSCDRKNAPANGQQPARDGAHPGHRAIKASAETQQLSRARRCRSNPPIGSDGPRLQRGLLAARVG